MKVTWKEMEARLAMTRIYVPTRGEAKLRVQNFSWSRRQERGGESNAQRKRHKLGEVKGHPKILIFYSLVGTESETHREREREKKNRVSYWKKLWIPPLPVLRDGGYAACSSGLSLSLSLSMSYLCFSPRFRSDLMRFHLDPFDLFSQLLLL